MRFNEKKQLTDFWLIGAHRGYIQINKLIEKKFKDYEENKIL